MALRRAVTAGTAMVAAMALAACGATPRDSVAVLEATLTNDNADPLIRDTLMAPLAVDPDLTGQANINAVRSGDRVPGNVIPVLAKFAGDTPFPPFPDGKRMIPPEPTTAASCPDCGPDGPATLGALAREHARRAPPACRDYRLDYGMQWAERVPPPFALFPGVALMDSAGADTPNCALRAVSLATPAPAKDMVDYYYTQTRHAGFTVRHQRLEEHAILFGARNRDRTSFMLIADAAPGGGSRIDLVVTRQP